MQRKFFGRLAWVGVVAVVLMASGVGFLWAERTSKTQANPLTTTQVSSATTTQSSPVAAAPQQARPLPEHPLEQMGVAGLTPSDGLPPTSLSEEEVIMLVTEGTWGPYREQYEDKYPASAMPATYDTAENTMGPAADKLPVWVVTLQGWGPPVHCGLGDFPSGAVDPETSDSEENVSQDQRTCTPGQSNAYVIVDAKTGQELGSWHYGEPVWK